MATQFVVQIDGVDEAYAENAAQQCFERIDELEAKLSRFIPDSDVSRINRMKEGDNLLLDYETYACLKQAIEISTWTGGAFDVGVAEWMNIFRGYKQGLLNISEYNNALKTAFEEKQQASIYVDPDENRIYCIKPGMKIDLGGIGKGFALDQLGILLSELGIENYALNSGDSTISVKGGPTDNTSWDFKIADGEAYQNLQLNDTAVSASGTYWQGNHIFDPRTGTNRKDVSFGRVWVCCHSAAYSDALSTALFLLNEEEVSQLSSDLEVISWVAYSTDEQLHILRK
ncbi:MAG: FAD:protein FMN transferase [Bacteroidota bacterium]